MKNTNITYAVALDYVLSHADLPENIADRLVALKDAVAKRNAHSTTTSPEKKAADKVKRAEARQSFLNEMLPIVRKGMDTTPRTVKEIYERIKNDVPEDFTISKLQYMFTKNEVGADVVKVNNGKHPFTYHI